jgi:catechol 2,3-dioxygenase-like lactoylglutathione lyase family enzyme
MGCPVEIHSLNVGAVIPVSDMNASRAFYEGTLGLAGEPAPGGYALGVGGTIRLFLDVAAYAGQADWPPASFQTQDIAATVTDLAARGVHLEIMGNGDPYHTDQRGIADLGDMLIAWFRDPHGRVISVFQLASSWRRRYRTSATAASGVATWKLKLSCRYRCTSSVSCES